MTEFPTHRRVIVVATLLVAIAGCNFMSRDAPEVSRDAPEVATPLGYGTVRVALPSCPSELPPVREGLGCGADEIGKTIDHQDVCRLLTSLKHWVESSPADGQRSPIQSIRFEPVYPDDWRYVRAVCVSHATQVTISDGLRGATTTASRFLKLQADAPNRSLQMWVTMSEQSKTLEYFSAPRRGGS